MKPVDRTEARAWWARVAEGHLEVEQYDRVDLMGWLQEVALEVLEADDLADAKQRPYEITRAVGLAHRHDAYAALRELIDEPAYTFPSIITAAGEHVLPPRAKLVSMIAAEALRRGLLRGEYAADPKRAKDLIRSLMKPRKPKIR